jgi:hypothetical protein
MDDGMKLYRQMLATANSVNELLQGNDEFNMISRDTAAKILAVVYIQGSDERMVLSPKLKADCDYIQERYHVQGGEVPDETIIEYIQHYVRTLEQHIKENNDWPQWVYDFFMQRYNFKLYKP